MKSILLSFLAGALSVVAATGSAAGPYDLTFSTFFGGGAGEGIRDVESDRFGNVYVAETTRSPDFPTTAGAYDEAVDTTLGKTRWGYNSDIFAAKFSPTGKLLWSTVIGGPNSEEAYGLEIDSQGHVVVHGRGAVGSPVTNDVYQPQFKGCGGRDPGNPHNTAQNAYVCKLTPDGTSLVWGSFFGIDHLHRDLALDANDDIYVTWGVRPDANDRSHWDTWMDPAWTAKAFQPRPLGGADCGVAKIAANGSRVLWATYSQGNLCLFGQTGSSDFPVSSDAYQPAKGARDDAVIVKLSPNLDRLVYGTFLGGEGNDAGRSGCVDDAGNLVVAGSSSGGWPLKNAFQTERKGRGDTVVARLSMRMDR